jgi:hypothetical protein
MASMQEYTKRLNTIPEGEPTANAPITSGASVYTKLTRIPGTANIILTIQKIKNFSAQRLKAMTGKLRCWHFREKSGHGFYPIDFLSAIAGDGATA